MSSSLYCPWVSVIRLAVHLKRRTMHLKVSPLVIVSKKQRLSKIAVWVWEKAKQHIQESQIAVYSAYPPYQMRAVG